MRPVVVTVGPLVAASANNIALSQTLGAAGSLTLNGSTASGGVATLDNPRRVAIASAGNDSGLTFMVTGVGRAGQSQSETITGANAGSAQSMLDYLTVTSITASGATASTVTAGTTAVASSAWVRLDEYATPALGGQVVSTGTTTWIVEGSFDDPNSSTNPVSPALMSWLTLQDSTATGVLAYEASPLFVRVTLNTGTGSLRATFVQYAELSQLQS